MPNFIIRIYPLSGNQSQDHQLQPFVGLIEEPLSGKQHRFANAEELWEFLLAASSSPPRPEDEQ